MTTLCNARVFDGETIQQHRRVIMSDGRIDAVVPEDDSAPPAPAHDCQGGLLAPGFVDVQVNGGDGILVNDTPEPERLRALAATHARFGTTALLPTLISDTPGVTEQALRAVHTAMQEGAAGLVGVHLEGPFINPERRGIHPSANLRVPDDTDRLYPRSAGCQLLRGSGAPERGSQRPGNLDRRLAPARGGLPPWPSRWVRHSLATGVQPASSPVNRLSNRFGPLFSATLSARAASSRRGSVSP